MKRGLESRPFPRPKSVCTPGSSKKRGNGDQFGNNNM